MSGENLETYDFLINEEDEAMLLLYVRNGEPLKPAINIDLDTRSAILRRNAEDIITLQEVPEDVIDSLQEADKLLVCELSIEQNDEDTKIVYAYEAEITD